MIAALVKAKPEKVGDILKDAVGCTVTREEHERLHKFVDEHGWDRYRKAELVVIDTETGERVI
jgi:Arc/MetJ family transcription regulator